MMVSPAGFLDLYEGRAENNRFLAVEYGPADKLGNGAEVPFAPVEPDEADVRIHVAPVSRSRDR